MKPTDPGADPAVNDGTGYSGEEERAGVMVDLIHMAFTCNLTRVATLMLSDFQSSQCVPGIALPSGRVSVQTVT